MVFFLILSLVFIVGIVTWVIRNPQPGTSRDDSSTPYYADTTSHEHHHSADCGHSHDGGSDGGGDSGGDGGGGSD